MLHVCATLYLDQVKAQYETRRFFINEESVCSCNSTFHTTIVPVWTKHIQYIILYTYAIYQFNSILVAEALSLVAICWVDELKELT